MQYFLERAQRKNTLLKARIRGERGWSDAVVSNVSQHGVGLKGRNLPDRGSYIEICTGPSRVVGQVRWSSDQSCGVKACEVIDIGLLISGLQTQPDAAVGVERRKRVREPTLEEQTEQARYWGRLIQFVFLIVLIAAGATFLGTVVFEVINKPLQQGSKVLASGAVSVGLPATD